MVDKWVYYLCRKFRTTFSNSLFIVWETLLKVQMHPPIFDMAFLALNDCLHVPLNALVEYHQVCRSDAPSNLSCNFLKWNEICIMFMFLLLTSKRFELQCPDCTEVVENFKTFSDLMWFLKIDWYSIELWAVESD